LPSHGICHPLLFFLAQMLTIFQHHSEASSVLRTGFLCPHVNFRIHPRPRDPAVCFQRRTATLMSAPTSSPSPMLRILNEKLSKAKEPPTIVTHSGTFHCDEALACYMLRLLPGLTSATVKRTRDLKYIYDNSTLKVVVDVGETYDPSELRFDHHQRGFKETLDEPGFRKTTLSSAGMVYKHFGRDIIRLTGNNLSDEDVKRIYTKFYMEFFEEIDAIDNGINPFFGDDKARYRYGNTGLSARVMRLNPNWNDDYDEDDRFADAMRLTGEDFNSMLQFYVKTWIPPRTNVYDMVKNRFEVHSSGEIGFLSERVPWKSHLKNVEYELRVEKGLKYVVYEDASGWFKVQAIPKEGLFAYRLKFPVAWRGLCDDKLSSLLSIPDCVFVHGKGFVARNRTKTGALKMAEKSLQVRDESGGSV